MHCAHAVGRFWNTWAFVGVILAWVVGTAASREAYGHPGDVDPSFGTQGHVTEQMGGGRVDLATALVWQPDGKLVAAGIADQGKLGRRLFAKLAANEQRRQLPVQVDSAIRDRNGRTIAAVFRALLERRR